MHYCGMCGVDLNLQLALGCRRLLDPLPIADMANITYLHSLLTVLTDADCYEGELSGDGTLCFGCANSLEQLEHLQRQVRHLVDLILNCYQQRYRNRRKQQQNGTDQDELLGPKLEDVKEEDTKEDIKEQTGDLVECETLLTVEKETITVHFVIVKRHSTVGTVPRYRYRYDTGGWWHRYFR